MTKIKDLHRTWSQGADYQAAFDALGDEFRLARVLIDTRSRAGLSQAELAVRMKTSQSYIARIEGGRVRGRVGPSWPGPCATTDRCRRHAWR